MNGSSSGGGNSSRIAQPPLSPREIRKLVLFSLDQATPDHDAPAGELVRLSGGSRLSENTHLIWRDSEKKELILKGEKITIQSGDPSQTGAYAPDPDSKCWSQRIWRSLLGGSSQWQWL